ncbi:hypothetical protein D3C84_1258300 [compost metagenome]
MAGDFAGYLEGPHRHTAMAIQQIVMLAELAVNRMLDNVAVPKPALHRRTLWEPGLPAMTD